MKLVRKTYPRYFVYDERPVVVLETPGAGLDCLAVDPRGGAFVRAMRYIGELDFNRDADIDEVPFEEFVTAVEMYRARKGLGEGAVKALYASSAPSTRRGRRSSIIRPSPKRSRRGCCAIWNAPRSSWRPTATTPMSSTLTAAPRSR